MSAYSRKRVLITGASGFIGSHVARQLQSRGAEVHAFVRDGSEMPRLGDVPGVIISRGDVTEWSTVVRAFRAARPEIVFHLAGDTTARRSEGGWKAVERSVAVNLAGTINVLRGASESGAPVRSIVRVGGLEEYGRASVPFVEGDRELPVSAYSAAQVAATHFCQALQPELSFQVVTLRPALVYGPSQSRDFFIPQLIESCLEGSDFEMTLGTQMRDLIYVDDVVEAILIAGIAEKLRGAVINVATGEEHAMTDVSEMVVRLTGSSIHINRGARATASSDLPHLVGSTEHAAATLGWRFRTSLAEGLERTVEWYRSHRTVRAVR